MFQILWQHWRQRPSRFVFTLLSLVLSTATLVAIVVASHNARSSFRELSDSVQGLPSIDIVNREGGRFQRSLLDGIAFPSGVSLQDSVPASFPNLLRGTILRFKENKAKGLAIGIPFDDEQTSNRRFLQESLDLLPDEWPGPDECLLSAFVASNLQVSEGEYVQCLFRRGFRKLLVKRVIHPNAWNRISGEHGVFVDLKWLQQATALDGQIDRFRLFLPNDAAEHLKEETERINTVLPSSLLAKVRTSSIGLADDLLKSTELGLSFASALAVAMAAYILLNTTRMNLAERRPHFAILRCLGATPWQIQRAVLVESIIMSVSCVAVGLIAGCFLGSIMGRILSSVLQAPPGKFTLPWGILIAIAIFLPALSLLVVWFAQKQQAAVSPLESFREPKIEESGRLPWHSMGYGLVLFCISLFGLYCVHREWIPAEWGVASGLLTLLAYLIWLPLGLIPLIWTVNLFSKSRKGFPLEIAKYQIIRRPERTSLNAGFLVISLCGACGLGQTLMSNTAEIKRWYHRVLPGDIFLINTRSPGSAIDSEDPLRDVIAQMPGLRWSNEMRFIHCQADQQDILAIVREFPVEAPFPTEPKGVSTADARKIVEGDQVLIGSILAKKLRKKAGDSITITSNGRTFKIGVGGVNANFANGGMSILINRPTAQRFLDVTGFEWYSLEFEPAQLDSAIAKFNQLKEEYGFEVQLGTDMRKGVEQAISGVTAGIWSVVLISFVTGGFGIATTLAMNMIEQARDFSLVRIVGASRGQLMMTVLAQAWLLCAIGIVFGLIGGVTTVLIILGCSEALLGYTPEFQWSPSLMILSSLGTFIIVTLAALIPAWNAARINPIEHLTYE